MIGTVTSIARTFDRLTPIDTRPALSTAVESARSNATRGGASSSEIVSVVVAGTPRLPRLGAVRVRISVSSTSSRASSIRVTTIDAERAPAGTVSGDAGIE